ncbi:hypothetical protein [Klebsiella quasipneumoniae]|uniref:hypothetical protein n=1 Tax=Klebsiella quasipneumoniae TaxID=1463165 RepID=UPI0015DBF3C6|nr:hypothetical protein WP3W18C02_P40140 [Klebsiella quasipneumoniae]
MPTKESNIVKRTLDLKKPPQLSAEQKARLDAVASMPDEQIDYSDAPYLPDAVWMKAAEQLPHTRSKSRCALMPKCWSSSSTPASVISRA